MGNGSLNHLDLTVSDLTVSRAFYDRVLKQLGFVGGGPAEDGVGWTHPRSRLDIALRGARGEHASTPHDRYAPGLHHLAFDADSRAEVDRLYELLLEMRATILDPPGEYYSGGYDAVFFADPDGVKLECVHLPR